MLFLTQSDTTTVYVNLTCCHPGYRYDKGSQTCLPDGGYIVRPDARNRYVYLQVEGTQLNYICDLPACTSMYVYFKYLLGKQTLMLVGISSICK